MDRVLTTEERIKRAQEIYERRQNQNSRYNTTVVNVNEKRNYKLLKKVIIQMFICFIIYYGFYHILNKQYVFTEGTINKAKEILSYDINFNSLYNSLRGIMFQNMQKEQNLEIILPQEDTNNTLEEITLSTTETIANIIENTNIVEQEPKSQMELDSDYIKQNIELVKPVEGTVSSEFGQRETTSEIISENHSGIDISALEGTKIVSAMSGTVTIAKNSNTYRKLYKNRKRWNCNNICAL